MLKLNAHGLAHAKQLIDQGKYALNTVWRSNEPTDEQRSAFETAQGYDAVAQWYLAVDDTGGLALPYGDFRRLHRSGVVAAKRRAESLNAPEVAEAAESLLDLLDRANAC